MFIDTHTHLSNNFGIEPSVFIDNAKEVGVNKIIVSCCDKESIIEGLELINKFDNIYLTVGFHPEEANNIKENDIDWLEDIVINNTRIIGIGEIGLDYYWVKDNKDKQISLFRKQLELANKLNLPIVIHSRDSIQEVYDILKEYKLTGVIHCFSGSSEMANLFIKLGYKIGIGGVVTFTNSKLYQVVEDIGINNIVLETDSPYLSPDRGKTNESKNIVVIAKRISEILDISLEEVERVTTLNACSIFDLNL